MKTNLVGQRFTRLLVISLAEDYISPKGNRSKQWTCLCDCGTLVVHSTGNLKKGTLKSCGCLQKEHYKKISLSPFERKTNRLYKDYVRNAKTRNLVFEITKEEFKQITNKSCAYCGEEANPINGIDRIDSSLGYIKTNIISCCTKCNTMKHDYKLTEFLEHITKIYNFNSCR